MDSPDPRPSPVRVAHVEVEGLADPVVVDASDGTSLWVEVTRRGQVVGSLVATARDGVLEAGVRRTILERYGDAPVQDPRAVPDEALPRISVVIPTVFSRGEMIERAVRSVVASDYPDFEVVVVDNRTSPGEPAALDVGSTRVRIVREPTRGASAARNCGVRESDGELVVFTDDDVEVDPLWLRALGAAFVTAPELDAAGGMVRPTDLETEPQLWFEEFFGGFTKAYSPQRWSFALTGDADPLFPYNAGRFGAGNNLAIRRTMLERIGGFDLRLGPGTPAHSAEDLLVYVRVLLEGGTVGFVPSALVRHTHRRRADEFREQVFNYGVGLTAMYTAMIVDDPRHLARIVRRLPRGLRMFFFPREPKSLSTAPRFPRSTMLVHALGMAYGPLAFARSALVMRRARSPVRRPTAVG